MDLDAAMTWASDRKNAVLITLRNDGRAQSSDIAYAVVEGTFWISITADRAKTANMRRDGRVVVHITEPGSWSYASFDGVAELTPVAAAVDDATSDKLVDYFGLVTGGPHSDWDEYRKAMVDDRRLLAIVTPASAVGQIH